VEIEDLGEEGAERLWQQDWERIKGYRSIEEFHPTAIQMAQRKSHENTEQERV